MSTPIWTSSARGSASRLNVEESIDPGARDVPVPPLILQPLVENAVRHGISPTVEGGTVRIEAKLVDDSLRIVVHDDGEGTGLIDLEEMLAEGYGLQERARPALRTRFGPGEWFKFESSRETGTRVELVLPLSGGMGPEDRNGGTSGA